MKQNKKQTKFNYSGVFFNTLAVGRVAPVMVRPAAVKRSQVSATPALPTRKPAQGKQLRTAPVVSLASAQSAVLHTGAGHNAKLQHLVVSIVGSQKRSKETAKDEHHKGQKVKAKPIKVNANSYDDPKTKKKRRVHGGGYMKSRRHSGMHSITRIPVFPGKPNWVRELFKMETATRVALIKREAGAMVPEMKTSAVPAA
ncbi:hypothetical protein ACFL96_01145 [Thermoproteota archaeon]